MKKHLFLQKQNGFTLIELMITVAIIAILASIAYPSYTQYIIRSKRSAAQAQMMEIANREQQFLIANRNYVDKTALIASGYTLPSEVAANYGYTITVTTDVPSFLLTFTPTTTGSQAGDGNLTLDHTGAKTPADKW